MDCSEESACDHPSILPFNPGFFTYIRERFEGLRPDQKLLIFQQEVAAFPEYYAQYFKR
jgi:hypothetical protein